MSLRCFPQPTAHQQHNQHQLLHWIKSHPAPGLCLDHDQQTALAKLVPLLLCGEQSATLVFHQENQRLRQQSAPMQALLDIEADETLHERALQHLLSSLPRTADQHQIKRRSQRFYAGINQGAVSVEAHFMLISQLDTCVCILMNTVANSSIKSTPVAELFNLIKQDEAVHVRVARNHAKALNPKVDQELRQQNLQSDLVNLLKTESASFAKLGINTDKLFKRLLNCTPTTIGETREAKSAPEVLKMENAYL